MRGIDKSRYAWVQAARGVLVLATLLAPGHEAVSADLAENRSGTTLERTIGLAPGARAPGGYGRLSYRPGWPLVVRQDLAAAKAGRTNTRRSLASFAHLTDMHITDPQSPARNPFARRFGIPYRTDFRNQGFLTLQVGEAMVRRINELSGGPATGRPLDFAVSTGDNGDGRQVNELRNYVALLDGGEVVADSSGRGYVGVQDAFVPPGRADIYDWYWHPDPPPAGAAPDAFKRKHGFPEYPGLLQRAAQNFNATGLDVPWYSGNGNHDGALVGYFRARAPENALYWNPLATGAVPNLGSQMFLDLPPGMDVDAFESCLGQPTRACVDRIFSPERPRRQVPANPARAQYLTDAFLDLHFESPPSPGPVGHGFTSRNRADGTLYYTFEMAPEVVGIMLDTVNVSGEDDGSIGTIQAAWLEGELRRHSSRHFDDKGKLVTTANPDRLIVIFSHHNLKTLNNATSLAGDPDPMKVLGADLEKSILRYPNVVLWVNGHSHVNRIWSHRSFVTGRALQTGFWEVNTASHVDFPQQSRAIEMVDNGDGTLSIFAILLDHLGPPRAGDPAVDILDLAAISRELAANDPYFFLDVQTGAPGDRNVELLIEKQF